MDQTNGSLDDNTCSQDDSQNSTMSQSTFYWENSNLNVSLAENQSRQANGIFLSVASPVFKAMLDQPNVESHFLDLHLAHVNSADWDEFYAFIDRSDPTAHRPSIKQSNVHKLAAAFHMYEMQGLLQVTLA
jgi:hypothetical protein